MAKTTIEPISDAMLPEFCQFLHENMPVKRSAQDWETCLRHQWMENPPNFGFVLRSDAGKVVGGIGAYYSDRIIQGNAEKFCNITSWCVLDAYRPQSMKLAMAVIGQAGHHFTDFSPTKVVGNTLKFFKFKELDERQATTLNLPTLFYKHRHVLADPQQIELALTGTALKAYRDHLGFAHLQHVVLGSNGHYCHVVYKLGRFKRFATASVLYIADRDVFARHFRDFATFLLLRGILFTQTEVRMLPLLPWPSVVRAGFNRKVFLSATLQENDIDYLYSEQVAIDL
ncbi:hypothetical protein O4H66_10380 [Comamonadaceae bacterium G21597-S1]|nr:hypothetical protein [Comamonadaceae bacterium G21597-S1]